MDHGEPHWRVNSSFSPPPLRIWDCRLQSDGLPRGSHGAPLHGSSPSSYGKGSISRMGSDQCANHQHSVSDGVLSYSGSPTDNFQAPPWTSLVPKFNRGEAGSSVGVSRSETSWFPPSAERRDNARAIAASPSFGSPSSLSESGHLESAGKQPLSFPNRNFSGRRSYTSKAVYPLVFKNPVSDCETFGVSDISNVGRLTPGKDRISPSHWPDNSLSIEHRFHKTLTELQRLETSPDPSASSRREGFRWSSASSYDLGFDGERFDLAEHMDVERAKSPNGSLGEQMCGVCGKLLWQKSPWSSHRIIRGGDMPVAGVLPCRHVFHAECLEQMTPKTQIHDPPCPSCLKNMGEVEESPSISEPLQMALRSGRKSRGVVISEARENHTNDAASNHVEETLRKNWPQAVPQWNDGGSSIKSNLRKHLTLKGKVGKDFYSTKMFRRIGSSSTRERVSHRITIR